MCSHNYGWKSVERLNVGREGYMQGWINTKWGEWMDASGKMNEKEDDLC